MTAEAAAMAGLATAVLGDEAIAPEIARAAAEAARLDPETVAALHRRTTRPEEDADLAALVRSAARPGLKQRILDYRAQVAARRKA
ncbi:hypothetical protein [Dankookia sp. P2]|uniref:hypothetical protein n=1 Tax=Dankookia sp. P2 TaxID=3423955 RepID=UPI003D664ADD